MRYPKYKQSGIEWLPEIPDTWKVGALRQFTDYTIGWTPSTENPESFEGPNMWANISDLGPRTIKTTSKSISDLAVSVRGATPSPRGSLLFSFKLSVGTVSIVETKMFTNEAIATFVDTNGLLVAYGFYALPLFVLQNASTNIYGAKMLNQQLIRSASLALPPLAEQKQIAEFLDRETQQIDNLITEQEALVENLTERRKAVITYAVAKGLTPDVEMQDSGVEWLGCVPANWRIGPVKFAGKVTLGKMLQSEQKSSTDQLAVYMRAANVQPDGHLKLGDTKRMWFSDREIDTLTLNRGDVVVVEGGVGGFGRSAYLDHYLSGWGFQNSINRIRPRKNTDGRFLNYALISARYQGFIHVYCNIVSMPHFTAEKLEAFEIPIPPLAEQRGIAAYLHARTSKIDVLIAEAKALIGLLSERRSALISVAVTGKIDVRGEVPVRG